MKHILKARLTKIITVLFLLIAGLGLAACQSDADKATENTSVAAENFEVQRHIVGVNGITDKYAFEVVGRCSVETGDSKLGGSLSVMCKVGPNQYKQHYVGLSDNVFYVIEQLDPIDVSVYHTRVIVKPENLLPEVELSIGRQ
jgi:hypothetical protein